MKLWILGAQGLVGKAVQRACAQSQLPWVATSRAEVDITSPSALAAFFHRHPTITHLINCAAYTQVDRAEEEREQAFEVNAQGPENLGRLARLHSLRVVHLSTDYVFNAVDATPLLETAPCQPVNLYGQSKHAGEVRLLEVHPSACIVRTSWVFGKGGKNFISSVLKKLQTESVLSVVHDQVSRLTSVDDLASAVLHLKEAQGLYHFANEGVVSRYQIAAELQRRLEARHLPVACQKLLPTSAADFPTPALRPRFSVLDTQKITSTQFTPRRWEKVLEEYLDAELP